MKKMIACVAAGVMATGSAMAAAGTIRDNCGCGLGTVLLKDKEPTVLFQLAATFLNGLASQSIGITMGTLECEPHAGFAQNKEVRQYIAANLDNLAVDVAQGEGATLDALADLMQVPAGERAGLYGKLQTRFDDIFSGEQVSSDQVVTNLDKILNG